MLYVLTSKSVERTVTHSIHLCWKPFANAAAAAAVFFLWLSLNCSVLLLHLHYITLSHFRLLIVCYETKNILTQFIY